MAENLAKLVTKEEVFRGIEFGNIAPDTLTPSKNYDVLILDKLYPSKEVIRLAVNQRKYDPSEYTLNEGEQTNSYLIKMGFPVFNKNGNYLGGGDTGIVWKLGTRWGSGNPNYNAILKDNNIVISVDRFRFHTGDLVAITDGHTINAIARVNEEMSSITTSAYKKLEDEFRNLKIEWGKWMLVANAQRYDLLKEEQFEYKLEAGIRQIQQEKVKKQVTELWFQKEYRRVSRKTSRREGTTTDENETSNKNDETEASSILENLTAIQANSYNTYDNDILPKLDVSILSKSFADLIRNLKNSPGQMLGIFGQWGRGKTYFMKQVEKELDLNHRKKADNEAKENQFYYLKFHAWKYQDTEGVWAYLYQNIIELYLTHRNNESYKHRNWFKRRIMYPFTVKLNEIYLLFRLNRVRNGIFDISLFVILLLVVIGFVIWYPELLNDLKYWNIFLATGVLVPLFSFFNKIWKLGDKGKRLIKTYTHRPNFNKILGIQAEIQEELKYILRAWMKTEFRDENGKYIEYLQNDQKRLLLFVDDIDRCYEERLIQVIDALRVMLEDDEILKRVIIVAAIDEDILERAIKWKYRNFINEKEEADRDNTLVKEYMDKLFISSLKLPPLYSNEKNEILDSYAEKIGVQELEIESDEDEDEDEEKSKIERDNISDSRNADNYNFANNNQEHFSIDIDEQEKNTYAIALEELDLLKEHAENITERVTPRQLRIFMYRYLLARNIGQKFNDDKELDSDWCELIMEEISKRRNQKNKQGEDLENLENYLNNLDISDKLKKSTNKIIEIVAPY